MIDDTQGHGAGGGTMPFRLWPSQVAVVWALMTTRLIVILKARQLGISWICCAYILWRCLFQRGQMVLVFSKGQDEADEMIRRVKALYERLPDWLLSSCPTLVKDNTSLLAWSNRSRVKSLPATKNAGRSFTASVVVIDEAAFQAWADALFTALKPTIDAGGQLIILSTANGIGNLFHRLWIKAVAGLNGFKTIFLAWWCRPGRDRAWYEAQLREYDDPAMVRQEYPSSATEAFLVSGRVRFKPEWIERQAANVQLGLLSRRLPRDLQKIDGLTVYVLPRGGRRYVIGADVAEGLEHGDYSAATLVDAETWEEIAHLHGHWEPDEFAAHLWTLARAYGAEIAVERNNHGHAVLLALKHLKARRVVRGLDKKAGWLTNSQTKPQGIDLLARALRDGLAKVRTQASLDEMQIYRIDTDGSTGAPSNYYDDRVMTWSIALQVAIRPTQMSSGNVDWYAPAGAGAAAIAAARTDDEIDALLGEE